MSVFGPNQVGDLIIGKANSAQSTVANFIASAIDKDIKVLSSDGGALSSGKKFKVFQKTGASAPLNYEYSGVVNPKYVASVNLGAYSPEKGKSVTVSGFTGNLLADTTYEVFVRILEDGGSLSPENFRHVIGNFVSDSTVPATVDAVIDPIIKGLQTSLDKSDPGAFSISKSGADIVISANPLPANPAKDPARPIYFDVEVKAKSNGVNLNTALPTLYSFLTVTTTQESFPGVGTGKYVANYEWFVKGYKTEPYRETAYPADFNEPYYADASLAYNIIELSYYEPRTSTSVERQYKSLSIAVEVDPNTVATNAATNGVLADLRTVLGSSVAVPADLPVI